MSRNGRVRPIKNTQLKAQNMSGMMVDRYPYGEETDAFVRECDVSVTMDSHVSVCSGGIVMKLNTVFAGTDPSIGGTGPLMAANVEHAPQAPWHASPFDFFRRDNGGTYTSKAHRLLPHNFFFAVLNGPRSSTLLEAWRHEMGSKRHGDDQAPLMRVLERNSVLKTTMHFYFLLSRDIPFTPLVVTFFLLACHRLL